jgi:hypothetical protein
VTGPVWYWWAGTGALILDAWIVIGAVSSVFLGPWLARLGGETTTEPPVPQLPRAAAPGQSHGGLAKTVYVYDCGRTVVRDHAAQTRRTIACTCPSRVDQDRKDLTQ